SQAYCGGLQASFDKPIRRNSLARGWWPRDALEDETRQDPALGEPDRRDSHQPIAWTGWLPVLRGIPNEEDAGRHAGGTGGTDARVPRMPAKVRKGSAKG